jgi:hypothetical protein
MAIKSGEYYPEESYRDLWEVGILSWLLWEQQIAIYECVRNLSPQITYAVLLCARQFGKSVLGLLMAIEDCLRNPNVCVLLVGPTIFQTQSIVRPRMRLLTQTAPKGLIREVKSENRFEIGSSELVIGGFDQSSSAQRGKTLLKIYIEEIVDSHPDKYNYSMKSDLLPALTHSIDAKMIFLTTLPYIEDHPFVVDTMENAKRNNAFFSFTLDDNIVLSQDKKDKFIEAAGGIDSPDCQREYFNNFVRDPQRLVVPDYNEKIHVHYFPDPSEYYQTLTIDFGGVRDKTAVAFHYWDFYNEKHRFVADLEWMPNTATKTIVDDIHGKLKQLGWNDCSWWADAPGQVLTDLQITYGIPVSIVQKSEWKGGCTTFNNLFRENKISVAQDCLFLRKSCRSGMFNKTKTDFERTIDLGHCDGIMAMVYGTRAVNKSQPFPSVHMRHNTDGQIFTNPPKKSATKQFTGGFKKFGSIKNG